MKPPATSMEVLAILGEIDALVLERILLTRASADEVREAVAEAEPSSPRVVEVRAIIAEFLGDDDEVDQPAAVTNSMSGS